MNAKIKKITGILEDRKGEDIKVLFVGNQTWITDYFIIVSGNSPVHARTLAESMLDEFYDTPVSIDGLKNGRWILLDYAEIMVHIFIPEARTYYRLEKLWADIENN
ncbi:MAG: ribosome silencing factor [Candidatus Omnitrophica bacterium]|nr:ribosome silencing factor [Candidatus Omnitrophota bacterium]